MSGFERTGKPNVPLEQGYPPYPGVADTLTPESAKVSGYTGSICNVCGSVRMRNTGHCMTCEECGSTTGCS